MKIAAIDIGTNSVLLTIAEKSDDQIQIIYEAANITRIGEGIRKTAIFKKEAMDRTILVLKEYKKRCEEHNVDKVYTVGTAGIRCAKNADEFVSMARKECNLDIDVISGEKEAELVFKAAEKDFGKDIIVIDIGGGSTELIYKEETGLRLQSIDMGSVYLTEESVTSDPINDEDFDRLISGIILSLSSSGSILSSPGLTGGSHTKRQLIATAGTATTLAAIKLGLKEYNHSEVHGSRLSINDIEGIINDLRSKTIEERKKIPGLEPKRADVILAGALILREAMNKFGFQEVVISDRGVRWGLILDNS